MYYRLIKRIVFIMAYPNDPRYFLTDTVFNFQGNTPLVADEIPVTAQELYIYCNQPLNSNSISSTIKKISFGSEFKQPINADILPSSVEKLLFEYVHPQQLHIHSIPSSVTELRILLLETILMRGIIPTSVNKLHIEKLEVSLDRGVIPELVTDLSCMSNSVEISVYVPPSVKKLRCNNQLLKNLTPNSTLGVKRLNLISYNLSDVELEIGDMPQSTKYLTFSHLCKRPIVAKTIPSNVVHIRFYYNFYQPLTTKQIPPSITHLTFRGRFTNEIDIDRNIKIQCQWLDHDLFLKKNFKSISFSMVSTEVVNYFPDDYIIYDGHVYSVKIKNTGEFSNISLKHDKFLKSARKI